MNRRHWNPEAWTAEAWNDAPWWWDVDAMRGGRARSSADVRPTRASDSDRESTLSALADEFAAGRLDAAEFEARQSRAQDAVYLHDLDPLFTDLPSRVAPRPSSALAVAPRRRRPPVLAALPALLFAVSAVLVLMLGLTVVGAHPWVLLVPLLVLWMVGGRARRRRWEMRHSVDRW